MGKGFIPYITQPISNKHAFSIQYQEKSSNRSHFKQQLCQDHFPIISKIILNLFFEHAFHWNIESFFIVPTATRLLNRQTVLSHGRSNFYGGSCFGCLFQRLKAQESHLEMLEFKINTPWKIHILNTIMDVTG